MPCKQPFLGDSSANRLRERGLFAADLLPQNRAQRNEFDILIGSNYYWSVETGKLSDCVTRSLPQRQSLAGSRNVPMHTIPATSGTTSTTPASTAPDSTTTPHPRTPPSPTSTPSPG